LPATSNKQWQPLQTLQVSVLSNCHNAQEITNHKKCVVCRHDTTVVWANDHS